MAAGEWSGFEDGDMEMDFAGAKFNVHRAIVAQASPVWKAMLTGTFAEATGDTIHFDGDDPEVARLCIEMIYSTFAISTLDWADIESRVMSDRAAVDEFVDKYDLCGVRRLVAHELGMENEKKCLEQEVQQLKRRGTLVDVYAHRPEEGTRVKLHDMAGGLDKKLNHIQHFGDPDDFEEDIVSLRHSMKEYTKIGVVSSTYANCVNVRWDDCWYNSTSRHECYGDRFGTFKLEYA